MKPIVVYLRPRAVVFIRARGPYSRSVGQAWDEMFEWLERRGFRDEVKVGYGLAHDDPRTIEADKCRYDACVELSRDAIASVGGEIRSQNLSGGAFVRSRVTGCYSNIAKTLSTIRDEWMPSQGLSVDAKRPVIAIYLSDPRFVVPEERKADICLPVRPT